MLVVTVEIRVKSEKVSDFLGVMLQQAKNSLEREEGCHYFDVCQSADTADLFFLYEIYTDKNAFDIHLQSPHFREFDATVSSWIENKDVRLFKLL
ncbi:MAG: antibiotic biosynthesis monooxygenase [Sneathiellales bacterium]|nr:antibiotic biosynthesis monooxygenase [Sneathiellales bacterium]